MDIYKCTCFILSNCSSVSTHILCTCTGLWVIGTGQVPHAHYLLIFNELQIDLLNGILMSKYWLAVADNYRSCTDGIDSGIEYWMLALLICKSRSTFRQHNQFCISQLEIIINWYFHTCSSIHVSFVLLPNPTL